MGNEKKEKFGTLGKMETEKWENGKSWKNSKLLELKTFGTLNFWNSKLLELIFRYLFAHANCHGRTSAV